MFAVFVALIFGGGKWFIFEKPATQFDETARAVIVPKGATMRSIADSLIRNGSISNETLFLAAAKLSGKETTLKAGKFEIPAGASHLDILRILEEGESVSIKVTVPEGLTSRKIAGILAAELSLDSTKIAALINDSVFVRNEKFAATSLEGFLFPETYLFPWGVDEKESLKIMLAQFQKNLPENAERKAKELGLSLYQILTLASLVEGEAVLDQERRTIAALYHNRLRKNMRLEADPTIQFIIPDGPRRLLNVDLQIDSPYNTYKYAGLPPGPINNPGKASIEAALNPTDEPYLFMVAKGDGSHIFNETYAGHRKAHQAFNEYRKKVAREKKMKNQGAN